jgi:hypothetical protein
MHFRLNTRFSIDYLNPARACTLFVQSLAECKERAWNNLNNYGAGFLVLTQPSQEAHSDSTQRLRSFSQEQKDQPECSSYFMHVPKDCLIFSLVENKSHFQTHAIL